MLNSEYLFENEFEKEPYHVKFKACWGSYAWGKIKEASDAVGDAFETAGEKVSEFADTGIGKVVNTATGGALGVTGKGLSATGGALGGDVEDMADVATGGVYSGLKDTVNDFQEGNTSDIVTDLLTGGGLTGYGGEAAGAGATREIGEAIENGGITLASHSSDGEVEEPESTPEPTAADQDETKSDASSEATQEGQKSAETAARETLALGGNPANANDLAQGTASSISKSQYNSLYGAMNNAKASTQADYLNKMGYSNALAQQAANIKKGAGLNIASGILQGIGAGASAGAGFSDVETKEPIGSETIEHLAKVLDMMKDVQKMKKGGKKHA